jgi:hypothetical protein
MLSMTKSQNPAIPAAFWRQHISLWRKIPQYQPKLAMTESPKTATDTRHGTVMADIR